MENTGKMTIVRAFLPQGEIEEIKPRGNGHINDTFCVTLRQGADRSRYTLQRINTEVFRQPEQLMSNVRRVTEHLQKSIAAAGLDPKRRALHVIPTVDGQDLYRDPEGNCYRMYGFIEDALCLEAVRDAEDFAASARAFGEFQKQLADFAADELYETIPHFHDTKKRCQDFLTAVEADPAHRAAGVQAEIAFVKERMDRAGVICDALAEGRIPVRVTHNDTKLNNILFDEATKEALCVIDLDTVMPGSALYDFGDAIRFGANTAAEDETDLSKVHLDLDLYRAFVQGYIEGCGGSLTEEEIRLLPEGARIMTYECGMRFLTDYLNGDIYFHVAYPEHNLIRCRTQFRLVEEMEAKWDAMQVAGI